MRLIWIGDPFARTHSWNEGHYAMTVRNFERYGPWQQVNDLGVDRGFTPLAPLMMYPIARISDWQPWGFRLPLALLGTVTLGVYLSLAHRRWAVPWEAALAGTAIAATAPGIVYYARNVQLDGVATAFLLSSMYLLGSSKARTRRWGWMLWVLCVFAKTSFVVFAPAILLARLSARPGDMRSPLRWGRAIAPLMLCILPAIAWIAAINLSDPDYMNSFFVRSGERSTAAIVEALQRTPGFFSRQLGDPCLILALVGGVILIAGRTLAWRRTLPAALLALCCLVFVVTHPRAYSTNRYYIYPSLFVLSALSGLALHSLSRWISRWVNLSPGVILAGLCAALMCVNAVLYVDHYGDWKLRGPALDAVRAGEDPFAGATQIAEMDFRPGMILVDYPSTMFYAGGDPERVRCAHGNVARVLSPEIDCAVILNTLEYTEESEAEFTGQLRSLGWREIAPRVWAIPAD